MHSFNVFFTAYVFLYYIDQHRSYNCNSVKFSEQHVFVQDPKFITKQRKIPSTIYVTFFFFFLVNDQFLTNQNLLKRDICFTVELKLLFLDSSFGGDKLK